MKKFLLIIKGEGPTSGSPEQLQQALMQYRDWASSLGSAYVDGQRLEHSGALLENKSTVATDGPFLESKEIIAGYIVVEADNMEAAVDIAKNCPLIEHCRLEVRPILALPE